MMQGTYEFSNTLCSCVFFLINLTSLLSLGPSTALVWLEIGVSYFPELPPWVDVENSLKNSTSHFFGLSCDRTLNRKMWHS